MLRRDASRNHRFESGKSLVSAVEGKAEGDATNG